MSVSSANHVDLTLVRPFFEAAQQVLTTMTHSVVTFQTPYRKREPYKLHDVTGQIFFWGEVAGMATLCFPSSTADRIVEAFAGRKLENNSPDFVDAIGELANMVAGTAKRHMGASAHIATPNVILGQNTIAATYGVPCIAIPGQCRHGEFTVEVSIKRVHAAKEI